MDWSDLEILAAHHTANEIAKIKHCTPKTVRQALRKNKLRAKRKNEELEQKAIELYTGKQQMSPYQIAPLLNKPRATIDKWIRNAGVSRGKRKAGKLAYRRSLLNTFVCNICLQRKKFSELTQSKRFPKMFGCQECIEKNDCIRGTIFNH
jgi:superfamily II helicase